MWFDGFHGVTNEPTTASKCTSKQTDMASVVCKGKGADTAGAQEPRHARMVVDSVLAGKQVKCSVWCRKQCVWCCAV